MKVLVAYAKRHGATLGIAERIARTLEADGLEVTLTAIDRAPGIEGYDAFVVGSAAYMGRWLKEASTCVRRHREALTGRPVWFFSSGPVGAEAPTKGVDPLKAAEPREFAEFEEELPTRDKRVFYGAYDPNLSADTLLGRLSHIIPAVKEALPAGDFRDRPAIEAWAHGIARELANERDLDLAHA